MRVAHLKAAERPLAVVDDGRVTPLSLEGIDTVDDLIAAGPDAQASRGARRRRRGTAPPGHARRPACPPPRSRAWGSTTTTTAARPDERPERPLIFAKFPSSLAGPDQQIEWPEGLTEQVDWEVELAVVIGRRVRAVSREALDAVFGYTAANDVSARDLQFSTSSGSAARASTRFCPLGPVVVTADEFGDPQDKRLLARVNGETMQDSTTAEMIFGVAEIVSFLSHACTLEPGDLVLTEDALGRRRLSRPARLPRARRHGGDRGRGSRNLANDIERSTT